MTLILKQSTAIDIRMGPFVDVVDAFTPETGVTIAASDQAEVLKANGAATVAMAGVFAAVTDCDGWYDYTASTGDVDTVGEVVFVMQDASVYLPVFVRAYVVEEAVYDAMYGAASAGPLQSTVAGRTLDVLATGEVPGDFDTTIGTLGATQIEANALDGKGDWNIGKTGYSLTQVFPTNFADLSIVVTTGLVDITQTAADKVWSTTVRTLTAFSTALALSVWDVLESAIVTASSIGLKLKNSLADTGEPGQGAPPVSASSQTKIDWLFKNFRNKKEQTTGEYRLFDNAGTTVDTKATVSDAASVTTKEEMASGP